MRFLSSVKFVHQYPFEILDVRSITKVSRVHGAKAPDEPLVAAYSVNFPRNRNFPLYSFRNAVILRRTSFGSIYPVDD